MAGYKRVNYYELCRLCTSSEGTKMHIFREEGRRRQLPTKIQICLPLQVCEDDSLPKIICSHCVDKLESFYDFRESCVNAEAMLESYFTSLRYSDDFTREGKVYVKDESPAKKKISEVDTSPKHHHKTALATATDGLNSLVQAAGIQIVSDAEGTRVQQYKCAMQMQPGSAGPTVVEAAATEARYSYETCTVANARTTDTSSGTNTAVVQVAKVEDGSTQCSETDFNNKQSPDSSDEGEVQAQQPQAVAFTTTGAGQEMLVHFNFNKDRDGFLRADDTAALQRSSIAQIGEFLRMKSVNIVEAGTPTALVEVVGPNTRPCDRCGKLFGTLEELQGHSPCGQEGVDGSDKAGAGGAFACEVCGKPFKRKEHLFQHRKLHTGERPYVCTSCGKAFSRKEHLVRHAVSHTGQKMHACDTCGKYFSRKDNLHKHRKTHGVAGPYVCDTCGKSFVVKHNYLMHRGSHAAGGSAVEEVSPPPQLGDPSSPLPYKCDVCNKAFAAKQYLATHKLRHQSKAVGANSSQQEQPPTDIPPPLTTINNAALLAPNILHHVTSGPLVSNNSAAAMIQVSSAAATAYLCAPSTVAATDILETYKRLHSA